MRVGMFVDMYKPWVSGVVNHVALNKAAMERAGHEVFVFAFGDRDHQDEEPNVIRSFGIPYGETGYRFGMGFSHRARSVIRTLDVAHAHHPFVSGPLALASCRPRSIPVLCTNHTRYDLYADTYAGWVPETLRDGYISRYLSWFYSAIDLTIAPSAGIERVLRDWGVEGRIEVLRNGIDLEPFRDARPLSREALGIAEDAVAFVFVGRLGPEKNIPLLTEAFRIAAEKDDRVSLVLVGDGPMREELERACREDPGRGRMVVTGMVPYEDVPAHVRAGDVFVTPSVSEVHPLTIMEAMAAGLPAVGIESPGVGDIIDPGRSGLLCGKDAEELASAMLAMCDDRRRSEMGACALESARMYDIHRTSAELLEVYRDLVSAPSHLRRAS